MAGVDVTLRAANYRRRVVDDELDQLIEGGACALSIDGAKGIGKSATAAERVATVFALEDPAVREIIQSDARRIVNDSAVLIDEWQHAPSTWDVVRRAVDAGARPGQFLLTGSASGPRQGAHSGAGRILQVRMRPMTLVERGVGTPTVSVGRLLEGDRSPIGGDSDVSLDEYVDEIVRSGFPGVRDLDERVRRAQLQGYVERVIDRDIADVSGRSVRNPAALRRWLRSYASATASCASYEKIRDAATSGDGDKPARSTTQPYRDALEALHLLDPLPAWSPLRSHIAELGEAPKHHLVDPALAASLVGAGAGSLLDGDIGGNRHPRDGTFLGALFESLVVLGVRVFAQSAQATVSHFRTHRNEHEVDLIIERDDGRVIAVEVKLSPAVDDHDVGHLRWLGERLGDDLLDAMVITTGRSAYRRPDGIAVVPAALLGP